LARAVTAFIGTSHCGQRTTSARPLRINGFNSELRRRSRQSSHLIQQHNSPIDRRMAA
jgi:hypothetical protein